MVDPNRSTNVSNVRKLLAGRNRWRDMLKLCAVMLDEISLVINCF
jgi:hypothetical protein